MIHIAGFYHWLLYGEGYQTTSGPIVLAGLITYWRRHNCHVRWCPFLSWHPHPDHGHPVCRRHHPHDPPAG